MTELLPPQCLSLSVDQTVVFLAGSIEMGKARNWQHDMVQALHAVDPQAIICNPRRKDWNSSWEQSIHNPLFAEQVHWELDHLERADLAVFYFQPDTMSPVTLMELGQRLATQTSAQQTLVCCPPGFWRKGNVDIFCARYQTSVLEDFDELVQHSGAWLRKNKKS